MIRNNTIKKKYKWFTATRLIVFGFLLIIFVGAGMLMLPFSTKNGGISFLDALFTATSATCVTGLVSLVTADTFTVFGQVVILSLIQLGGLGFMSLTSFIYLAFSRRVTLTYWLTMREDISDGTIKHIRKLVSRMLLMTFISEGIGAIILTGAFSRYMNAGEAVWNGIFHSVSAFCNAGFDIISANSGLSMNSFSSDPLILLTLSALIIVGGLGFLVVCDMWDAKIWRKYRLHTKIVLLMTAILITVGTVFFFAVEYRNPDTMASMNFGDKLLNSFFLSVTARTAGYHSVTPADLAPASRIFADALMFIGASPGSTGGGIKTTTLFILVIMVVNVIRQKRYAIVDKQTIGSTTVHKASAVFALALFIMTISMIGLLLSDGKSFTFEELLFEQISAYATVGLSLGVTANLSIAGKLIIILNMFLGRVGVLTFFISFTRGKEIKDAKISYPECSVII